MTMSTVLHRGHLLPHLLLQVKPQARVKSLAEKLATEHKNKALILDRAAAHAWAQPRLARVIRLIDHENFA